MNADLALRLAVRQGVLQQIADHQAQQVRIGLHRLLQPRLQSHSQGLRTFRHQLLHQHLHITRLPADLPGPGFHPVGMAYLV